MSSQLSGTFKVALVPRSALKSPSLCAFAKNDINNFSGLWNIYNANHYNE